MKIIVRNKRKYNDKQELTLEEFKAKFKNELNLAIQSFVRHKQQNDMLKPPYMHLNNDYESDFYSDLRWNFNNNTNLIYYIDKIQ